MAEAKKAEAKTMAKKQKDFIPWLHELPWWHISNLQFTYFNAGGDPALREPTYGAFLYTHYVQWCERHGFTPSEFVDILGD